MIVRDSNPATVPRMIQQADALSVAPFPLPTTHIRTLKSLLLTNGFRLLIVYITFATEGWI